MDWSCSPPHPVCSPIPSACSLPLWCVPPPFRRVPLVGFSIWNNDHKSVSLFLLLRLDLQVSTYWFLQVWIRSSSPVGAIFVRLLQLEPDLYFLWLCWRFLQGSLRFANGSSRVRLIWGLQKISRADFLQVFIDGLLQVPTNGFADICGFWYHCRQFILRFV